MSCNIRLLQIIVNHVPFVLSWPLNGRNFNFSPKTVKSFSILIAYTRGALKKSSFWLSLFFMRYSVNLDIYEMALQEFGSTSFVPDPG